MYVMSTLVVGVVDSEFLALWEILHALTLSRSMQPIFTRKALQ
jgi:hypothetical protein